MSDRYDAIVVGGGFFGLTMATHLAGEGLKTLACERGDAPMSRASYANQARIHNGYHYPRSVLTAVRSRVNFPRFCKEFRKCVVDDFEKLYAVPRKFSKVSARQFFEFMRRIEAPISVASGASRKLFDFGQIEEAFLTVEYAFDPVKLKDIALERYAAAGGEIRYRTRVTRVEEHPSGGLAATLLGPRGETRARTARILNCTYSMINELLVNSGLPRIRLKHELTEMAVVELPDELRTRGVTVMCGPFFSCMPFPPLKAHTLSHVRYTPHCSWTDDGAYMSAYDFFDAAPKVSRFRHMANDAARFVPLLREARQIDSIWEVKTVLPQSEADDSRPILFRHDHGLKGLTCVMGGKIDNVFDAIEEYRHVSG